MGCAGGTPKLCEERVYFGGVIMCTASKPSVAETPASPEPVKVTEEEQAKARATARNAAIRRYGVGGTDVTKGAASLDDDSTALKRTTLGA